MAPRRWTIYALGGGLGHLQRSLALARRGARRGVVVRIVANSFWTGPFVAALERSLVTLEAGVEFQSLPSDAAKPQIVSRIADEFRQSPPPDVLIVDTFPRGLAGELPRLFAETQELRSTTKVLVQRDLNPEYARWADLETFAARYDAIFLPGEASPLPLLPQSVPTPPWLVCEPRELVEPTAARAALGVGPDVASPLVVVSGCGRPNETREAAEFATRLSRQTEGRAEVRFTSVDADARRAAGRIACSPWPLMAALRGVDLLVGAGGYNTVWEARATETPLVALARPRLYDRQACRLRPEELAADWEHAWERTLRRLEELPATRSVRGEASFVDGAEAAAQHILAIRS